MKIELCFGSSCHVKGSKKIFALLQEALSADNLTDKVELAGTLCLGECKANGANLKIDDKVYTGIRADNFDEFYAENIKKPLIG
ncbi:MAG: (2Fe-2S) ferredoxin domain-containing protein [Spirochaetales bacterium]|nr:(2Fe-2S) ferredoxin domain-containing protein [Spirochaetales bacterium]